MKWNSHSKMSCDTRHESQFIETGYKKTKSFEQNVVELYSFCLL